MSTMLLRHQSFRSGLLISMAANVLAKGISFLVNPTIAHLFGVGPETDIYFFCLGTITTVAIFMTSINATVMIPYALHLEAREKNASHSFLTACTAGYGAVAALLCLVLFVFPVQALTVASGIPVVVLKQNLHLIRAFAPLIPLMTLTNALADILLAFRFFTVPVIAGGVTSLATLIFLFAFRDKLGLASGASGLAAAYCLNLAALIWLLRRRLGWRFWPLALHEGHRLRRDASAALLGNCTSFATNYLPYYLLTHAQSGALTAFTYAQTAAGFANSLVLAQFSAIAGVRLNEVFASQDTESGNALFVRLARSLQFVLAPLAILICVLAQDIILLLFGHGRLDRAGLSLATDMLRFLAILVPLSGVNTLCSRLFTAARQVEFSFWYQLSFSAALAIVCLVSVAKFGPIGYPAAVVLLYLANVFVLRWIMSSRFPELRYDSVLRHFAMVTAVASLLGAAVFPILRLWLLTGMPALFVGAALYGGLFVAANVLWPLDSEIMSFAQEIGSKARLQMNTLLKAHSG